MMPSIPQYNPDEFLTSLWDSLEGYLKAHLDTDIYDVQLGYPDILNLDKTVPFPKALISFDINDLNPMALGLGESSVNEFHDEFDRTTQTWEAFQYEPAFAVNIFAAAQNGGPNARLNAMQSLSYLFNGPRAREEMMQVTDGIEILGFTGGRFVLDTLADQPVWRVVDLELKLRVFGRRKLTPLPAWEDIVQEPGIEIQDDVPIPIEP